MDKQIPERRLDGLLLHEGVQYSPDCISENAAIVLVGSAQEELPTAKTVEALVASVGRHRIKSISIDPSSSLRTTAELASAFAEVAVFRAFGLKLTQINGLEHLSRVELIEIDTGRNKGRTIEPFGTCPASRLVVRWAKPDDIVKIGTSSAVTKLELLSCSQLQTYELQHLPLKHIKLDRGRFETVENLGQLIHLESIHLLGCSNLRKICAHGSTARLAIIESCNRLDIESISSLTELRTLYLISIKQPLDLDRLCLPNLESLHIKGSRDLARVPNILSTMPMLRRLVLADMGRIGLQEVSRMYPSVVVSNGRIEFIAGSSPRN